MRDKETNLEHEREGISYWKLLVDRGAITKEVAEWSYNGSGTTEDPYVVEWIENDPRNPMEWSKMKKWACCLSMGFSTLAISFCSSAYTGGLEQIIKDFHISLEVGTLGVSFFVLGFALGPLLWAPFSELYGRQVVFLWTYFAFVAFTAGAAGSQNIWTLIILRFFASAFGSSPLTNAGGVVADIFDAKDRGLAMAIFAAAPTMGPVLGPIAGGFLGMKQGWRWVEGLMAIVSGISFFVAILIVPETYAPTLLRKRAQALSKVTGRVYVSKMDTSSKVKSLGEALSIGLSRPWILLFREPIVFLLSLYMAIIYGTLYMTFGAYPIVYRQSRGWNQGVANLPFLGVAIGMVAATLYSICYENKRYIECEKKSPSGFAAPEDRLPPSIVGGIAMPAGLFWFAWTNAPSLPWAASTVAGIPFGFGMVLIFLSIMNYLVDAYTIYAASVLAANNTFRSLFGAAFPLFTSQMYSGLGIHWASSVPAFLALACLPFAFIFYRYGGGIRKKCKYAAEANEFMEKLRSKTTQQSLESSSTL